MNFGRIFPNDYAIINASKMECPMLFARLFRDHPASVGETYFEHMGMASSFGWAMLKASGACFVHALVPGLCEKTGSTIIRNLHTRMVTNRVVNTPEPESDDAMLWIAANI